MSIETIANSVKALLESVRKGPLIAFLLLLMGQNVFQMLRNEKLETRLNDVQDNRVKEYREDIKVQDRVIGLQDSVIRLTDENTALKLELKYANKKYR